MPEVIQSLLESPVFIGFAIIVGIALYVNIIIRTEEAKSRLAKVIGYVLIIGIPVILVAWWQKSSTLFVFYVGSALLFCLVMIIGIKFEKKLGRLGEIVAVGLMIGIPIAVLIVPWWQKISTVQPFESHLVEYTSASDEIEGDAYITGKVITVGKGEIYFGSYGIELSSNPNKAYIDDIYFDLPDSLRANSPEEVGTVILLEWGRNILAEYEGGSVAAQITCLVSVIDMKKDVIVGRQSFGGSPPETPEVRSCVGSSGCKSIYGSAPTQNIVEYISKLPRK